VTVLGPLGGGNRNSVLELRRGTERLVARRSPRSAASLDWEVGLLDHLARHGLTARRCGQRRAIATASQKAKGFLPRLDVAAGSSCVYHTGFSSSSDELPGLRR
jgi:hypothetical protein